MTIQITKTQETINDVPKEPKYRILITQHFGTGRYHHEHSESLYDLDREDVELLRDKLNEMFPTPTP